MAKQIGHRLWTREELIVALNLYLKLPFGKLDSRTPEIIHLAKLLNRTPGAISMRLNNFAAVDPYHQQRGITGLQGGINQVKPIWDEFMNNKDELLFESERILAEKENKTIEGKYQSILADVHGLEGKTKLRLVKTRVNQDVFRQIVVTNYNNTCCITGLKVPELLIASHITPWSKYEKNRLDPSNGICLNALHDRAFDKGLLTIDATNYTVKISSRLKRNSLLGGGESFFFAYEGKQILLPKKFLPEKTFLKIHNGTFKQ